MLGGLAWSFSFAAGSLCKAAGPGWGTVCAIGLGGLGGMISYYISKDGNTSDFWGYVWAFAKGAIVGVFGSYGKQIAGWFLNTRVGWWLISKMGSYSRLKSIVTGILNWIYKR